MKKPNRRSVFFTLLLLCPTTSIVVSPPAFSVDCTQTCVEVRREGGELVITARRDPIRSAKTVRPSPAASPTQQPVQPTQQPVQPTRPRPKATARSTPRPTFSDQIRELLPDGSFRLLPARGALIHEPLLVRAFGCSDVTKTLPILDTQVELRLTPRIEWSWGDGQRELWSGSASRGAHIYTKAGRYLVQMNCYWSGAFRTPHSPWAPIPEGISSSARQSVELFRAQVLFTE